MDTNQTENRPETPKPEKPNALLKIAGDIFDILEPFVFCAAAVLFLFCFIVRPVVVEGSSMENTLLEGEYLLVSDAFYSPEPGDIIVAHNVGLPLYSDPLVKRVIAVEGQVVNIDFSTWTLTVDGTVVDEPYRKLDTGWILTSDLTFPVTVPEGCVFVMGDNRNHSADSRSKDVGFIDERCIVGKAILRFLPFTRFTVFD